MLVNLHDKQKLYALAKDNHPKAREELANVMADLLTVELSFTEVELVTDVLLNVVLQAEKDLRAAISERVAAMEELPLRLALSLANDSIDVADPVLRFSQVLNDMDLVYIIKSQKSNHWQAIADRKKMSDVVMNALADTKDIDTAVVLSRNENVTLSSYSMDIFSDMTAHSNELATSLLNRPEFPEALASKVYELVSSDIKKTVKREYHGQNIAQIEKIVDDVTSELSGHPIDDTESNSMIVAAEMMMSKGTLSPQAMVQNLKRGQIQNFMAMFSVYCGLSLDVVLKVLQQNTGQGLAVICKALGIMKPDFINMYLLTAQLRGSGVIKQEDLKLALSHYENTDPEKAKELLNTKRH